MKKSLLMFSVLFLAVGSFTSCKDDDKDEKPKYDASNFFSSDYDEYGFDKAKQNFLIDFKSSCIDELEIINKTDWLDNVVIYDKSYSIFASIAGYNGEYARSGEILIRTKDKKYSKSIKIIQEGNSGFCPNDDHPHAINIGIGVKWACCNVDASAPWEYGAYYSWGETRKKEDYSESNYLYFKDCQYTDIAEDIANTDYDVAHRLWKAKWMIPSNTHFEDLRNKCSSEWKEMKGKTGRRFKGKNGVYIFLPAAGYRSDNYTEEEGSYGHYWSSVQQYDNSSIAIEHVFNNIDSYRYSNIRYCGLSIRPVTE